MTTALRMDRVVPMLEDHDPLLLHRITMLPTAIHNTHNHHILQTPQLAIKKRVDTYKLKTRDAVRRRRILAAAATREDEKESEHALHGLLEEVPNRGSSSSSESATRTTSGEPLALTLKKQLLLNNNEDEEIANSSVRPFRSTSSSSSRRLQGNDNRRTLLRRNKSFDSVTTIHEFGGVRRGGKRNPAPTTALAGSNPSPETSTTPRRGITRSKSFDAGGLLQFCERGWNYPTNEIKVDPEKEQEFYTDIIDQKFEDIKKKMKSHGLVTNLGFLHISRKFVVSEIVQGMTTTTVHAA